MPRVRAKQDIGKIIRKQRKGLSITLKGLSKMSGVSASHLSRIENEQRFPSSLVLQAIAKPLGYDVSELLIIAGLLSPEPNGSSKKERTKLWVELKSLLEPTLANNKRVNEIIKRLQMSS